MLLITRQLATLSLRFALLFHLVDVFINLGKLKVRIEPYLKHDAHELVTCGLTERHEDLPLFLLAQSLLDNLNDTFSQSIIISNTVSLSAIVLLEGDRLLLGHLCHLVLNRDVEFVSHEGEYR